MTLFSFFFSPQAQAQWNAMHLHHVVLTIVKSSSKLKVELLTEPWARAPWSSKLSTKANRSCECHLRRSKSAWFTIGVQSPQESCLLRYGENLWWERLTCPLHSSEDSFLQSSVHMMRISVVNSNSTSYLWTLSETTPVVQWWSQQRLNAATSSLWPTINIQQEQSVY